MKAEDIMHLEWVYNRMKYVHEEHDEYDYMIRFREILDSLRGCTTLEQIEDGVEAEGKQLVCDVCGSTDVIEAPHMGKNCNQCHPL